MKPWKCWNGEYSEDELGLSKFGIDQIWLHTIQIFYVQNHHKIQWQTGSFFAMDIVDKAQITT